VFARLHILETTPEQNERGLEIVRDQLLPWLRDSTGFRGLLRLSDREGSKTLVITLWTDEDALRASAEAGNRLSELTAETVGVTRKALEEYEVTLFDVDARHD
jgi:heme-degrading monooxygenase HmoA